MATTSATGATKPADAKPTPAAESIAGSGSTKTVLTLIALIDASRGLKAGTDPDALINHLRDARETLGALDLNEQEKIAAAELAENWLAAVRAIIDSPQPDDLRQAVEDIKIHTQLVVTCDALETAVG